MCGIVGGFVYRGSGTPALAGRYVYGDLCATDIRAFSIDDGRARGDARVATVPETPVSFGEDAAVEEAVERPSDASRWLVPGQERRQVCVRTARCSTPFGGR